LPEPSASRDLRLDFFRGLALIFIFIDHIPQNVLGYFTLQAVGFYDAAEIFIFVSGFTAALVYGRALDTRGAVTASAQIWRRAWQLYVAHIFLFVLFVAEVSYLVATFNNPMYNEEMRIGDFLGQPHVAIVQALLLQFQPTFLDILPLYIVLLLAFPAILLGLRRWPTVILLASFVLWLLVQVTDFSLPAFPPGHTWFFDPLAWQFLFTIGAALGYAEQRGWRGAPVARRLLPAAIPVVALSSLIKVTWTLHGVWETVPALWLRQLWPVDKSNLAPLRLLPFLALVIVVGALVPREAPLLRTRAARPLLLCGQHSLEIFCLGILLSALAHLVLAETAAGLGAQLLADLFGIVLMCVTAQLLDWYRIIGRRAAERADVPQPRRKGGVEP
jgi:hypothetical protein